MIKKLFFSVAVCLFAIVLAPTDVHASTLTNVSVTSSNPVASATTTLTFTYTIAQTATATPSQIFRGNFGLVDGVDFDLDAVASEGVTITDDGVEMTVTEVFANSGSGWMYIRAAETAAPGSVIVVTIENIVNPETSDTYALQSFGTATNGGSLVETPGAPIDLEVTPSLTNITNCTQLRAAMAASTGSDTIELGASFGCDAQFGTSTDFAATLDGMGYTLTLTGTTSLFDDIDGGEIYNLTVTGTVMIEGGVLGVGGIANRVLEGHFENVTNSIRLIGSDLDDDVEGIGGFFGSIDEDIVVILESVYNGSISIVSSTGGVRYVGGVVGVLPEDGGILAVVTSTMGGSISVDTVASIFGVGGIIGSNGGIGEGFFDSETRLVVNNTHVTTDITMSAYSEGFFGESIWGVGGLIGVDFSSVSTMEDSSYNGDIDLTDLTENTIVFVGGAVGQALTNSSTYTNYTQAGTISVSSTYGGGYIGGMFGFLAGNTTTLESITSTMSYSSYGGPGGFSGGLIGAVSDDFLFTSDLGIPTLSMNDVVVSGGLTYTVSEDEEAIGAQYVGGVVGQVDEAIVTATSVRSDVDITYTSSIDDDDVTDFSGMFGYIEEGSLTLEDSEYTGDIDITITGRNAEVSSIAGVVGGGDSVATFELTDIETSGDITILANTTSSQVLYVAGFVGYFDSGEGISIEESVSETDIMIVSEYVLKDVGGFFGEVEDTNLDSFSQNYYNGTMNLTGGSDSFADVGGIAGEYIGDTVYVSSSYAIVDITLTATSTVIDDLDYVGGLFGDLDYATSTLTNVFAAGSITADISVVETSDGGVNQIGGLIGSTESEADLLVQNAYADVDITITAGENEVSEVAGLIGDSRSGTRVESSFAAGVVSITTNSTTDRIGGLLGDLSENTVTNSFFDMYRTGQTVCTTETSTLSGCTGYNENNYAATSGRLINNSSNAPVSSWDFENVWQLDADYYPVLAFVPYDGSVTLGTGSESSGNTGGAIPVRFLRGNNSSNNPPSTNNSSDTPTETNEAVAPTENVEETTTETPIDPTQDLQCTSDVYLTNAVQFGQPNNPADVRLLEEFLNTYENANLPVDGVYGQADFDAVVAWQEKYAADILTPWGITNGTGYVYTKSLAKIKEIHEANCATATPAPTTPVAVDTSPVACLNSTQTLSLGMNNTFVVTAQQLLKKLGYFPADIDTTGYFGPITQTATIDFQGANGIDQLGIIGPQTRATLNELGC